MTTQRVTALLLATALSACGDDPSESQPVLPTPDAGTDCTCPVCEAGTLPDTGTEADAADTADALADAAAPAEDEPLMAYMTLVDGGTAEGEWVATYNHLYWWNDAEPEFTYALFDIDQLNPYPVDRSFRFLEASEVASIELLPWPPGHLRYRDAMRNLGFTLGNLAVGDTAHVITGNDSYHLEEDGYGDFAFDLVLTDDLGRRYVNGGTQNEDHFVWDAEVFSPVTGEVIEVVRDMPDNQPGGFELNAPANGVGISIGGSFYLYLYHFKQGTIPESLEVGSAVFEGASLGRVGNSGMTEEPHLHIALYWYDETAPAPRSWSVPLEFQKIGVAPTPTGPFVSHEFVAPEGRTWIRTESAQQ